MEKIECEIKVFDNFLEIIPLKHIEDNSEYKIKIKDIKSKNTIKKTDLDLKICTAFSPCYISIKEVKSLFPKYSLSDETILYQIREASRFADFILSSRDDSIYVKNFNDEKSILFEKEQFVKYQSAYNCMLQFYMDKQDSAGTSGALGDASFDNKMNVDISDLLSAIKKKVDFWKDSLSGYTNIGRAKPKWTVKGAAIDNWVTGQVANSHYGPINNEFKRGCF